MFKSSFAGAFLSLCLVTTSLAAGEGTAVGVDPQASAKQGSAERTLVVGADVSVGDQIVTGPSGRVQLVFADDTRIVVGPGSTLKIETYLLKGNTAEKFAVNALAGTFRFISGNSPKPAYSINTPTASIAVRGTKFDITVTRQATQTMLYDGALRLCRGSDCVDLVNRCDLGVAATDRARVLVWNSDERGNTARNFPLANIQSVLLQPFRVAGAQACLSPPPVPSTDSLVQPNSSSGTTTPPTTTPPTNGGNIIGGGNTFVP